MLRDIPFANYGCFAVISGVFLPRGIVTVGNRVTTVFHEFGLLASAVLQ